MTAPARSPRVFQPSLLIVGTGIEGASHATLASQRAIEQASKVLFAVADAATARWIRTVRPDAESLAYGTPEQPRREIYAAMVERILAELRAGERVCAAFYGNPAFLTRPAHAALEQARAEGFVARMLPGVSSLDCLFADLAIDPGDAGCQLYEATDFLLRPRAVDVNTPLVLLQVALAGNRRRFDTQLEHAARQGRMELRDRLLELYPATHRAVLYQASTDSFAPHRVTHVALSELADHPLEEAATLLVPGVMRAAPDLAVLERLQLSSSPPAPQRKASSHAEHDDHPAPNPDHAAAHLHRGAVQKLRN
jgi:precorrin-6B methylase 1